MKNKDSINNLAALNEKVSVSTKDLIEAMKQIGVSAKKANLAFDNLSKITGLPREKREVSTKSVMDSFNR